MYKISSYVHLLVGHFLKRAVRSFPCSYLTLVAFSLLGNINKDDFDKQLIRSGRLSSHNYQVNNKKLKNYIYLYISNINVCVLKISPKNNGS